MVDTPRQPWVCISAVAVALVAAAALARADTTLYATDFESFYPTGDDSLVGADGWLGTNTGEGLHGVGALDDSGLLGVSGYLGGAPEGRSPSDPLVIVWRPVNYDPVAAGTPVIRFFATVGVSDDGTSPRDNFYLTVYNRSGEVLAAINFDNTTAGDGLIDLNRWDGSGAPLEFIGQDFPRNTAQELAVEIDFAANRWSASLPDQDPGDGTDTGVALFADAPFTATTTTRDLGSVAVEWQITLSAGGTVVPGHNYFIFDNWEVTALGEGAVPPPGAFEILTINSGAGGGPRLRWPGQPGYTDRVEFSPDLASWSDGLPGSALAATEAGQVLEFTDTTHLPGTPRHYRVRRQVTP